MNSFVYEKVSEALASYDVPDYAVFALYNRLSGQYSNPSRFFHTLEHIEFVLKRAELEFEHVEPDKWPLAYLAIAYHDVVYTPGSALNEKRSANFAVSELQDFLPVSDVERIAQAILATDYGRPFVGDSLCAVVVDADLSSLARPWKQFCADRKKIKLEFKDFSEEEFVQGTVAFFKKLLERPRIFQLPTTFKRYEFLARHNMTCTIAELESKGVCEYVCQQCARVAIAKVGDPIECEKCGFDMFATLTNTHK